MNFFQDNPPRAFHMNVLATHTSFQDTSFTNISPSRLHLWVKPHVTCKIFMAIRYSSCSTNKLNRTTILQPLLSAHQQRVHVEGELPCKIKTSTLGFTGLTQLRLFLWTCFWPVEEPNTTMSWPSSGGSGQSKSKTSKQSTSHRTFSLAVCGCDRRFGWDRRHEM